MRKNIKGTNIDITPAIADYIDKRFGAFDRFVNNDPSALCDVEVGVTSRHHKSGDIFKAEVNLRFSGQTFYAVSEKNDLYAAIDEVKDEVVRSITSHKDRSATLMRKGALKIKNIIKGLDFRGRFRK